MTNNQKRKLQKLKDDIVKSACDWGNATGIGSAAIAEEKLLKAVKAFLVYSNKQGKK